jgi:hypothetical protein
LWIPPFCLAVSVFLTTSFAAAASCAFFFWTSRLRIRSALFIKVASPFLPDSSIQRLLLLDCCGLFCFLRSAGSSLRNQGI